MKFPDNMFINLPAKAFFCGMFTLVDLRLYGTIANFCNMNGSCQTPNEYFAELLNVDDRTIRRSLNKLEKLTFISIDRKGNKRDIKLPFFPDFQAVENYNYLKNGEDEEPKGVLEIVAYINEKQEKMYPGYSSAPHYQTGPYATQLRLVILTLAKAVYNSGFVGVKMCGRKVTENMLHDLVEVFDIAQCVGLVNHLRESFEDVNHLDYYIMTSLFNAHKKQLHDYAENRELHTEREVPYETLAKVKAAIDNHFKQNTENN